MKITGKDLLDIAAGQFRRGEIDRLCIVAPADQYRSWVDVAAPLYFGGDLRVRALTWPVQRDQLDEFLGPPNADHQLRVLAVSWAELANALGSVGTFIRSGRCLLVIDQSERRGRLTGPATAPNMVDYSRLAMPLREDAASVLQWVEPLHLNWAYDTVSYCQPCAIPLLSAWKGWPHQDPIPLLPRLRPWGCERCGSTHGPKLPSRHIAWVDNHSTHNLGLPDLPWTLAAVPSFERTEHWNTPYAGETACPLCNQRAVYSRHGLTNVLNCGQCGILDPNAPKWCDGSRGDVDGLRQAVWDAHFRSRFETQAPQAPEGYALPNVEQLHSALSRAKANSAAHRPPAKLRFGDLIVRLGYEHLDAPDAIYWSRRGTLLGHVKRQDSCFLPSRYFETLPIDDQQAIIAHITSICSAPYWATVQHGRSTSTCACCGRPFHDPVNIARGTHPHCEKRFFE